MYYITVALMVASYPIGMISGYPWGAPLSACSDGTPGHGIEQNYTKYETPKYKITMDPVGDAGLSYELGIPKTFYITVHPRDLNDRIKYYQGIIVTVFTYNDTLYNVTDHVGTFFPGMSTGDMGIKGLRCDTSRSDFTAATHATTQAKDENTKFVWKTDVDVGAVVIMATVAEDKGKWWRIFEYMKSPTSALPTREPPPPTTPTTPAPWKPTDKLPPNPPNPNQASSIDMMAADILRKMIVLVSFGFAILDILLNE